MTICRVCGVAMTQDNNGENDWTPAERQALRQLIRTGLILLLAIVIAGAIRRAFELGAGDGVVVAGIRGIMGRR